FGSAFAVGGRQLGLTASIGTPDLAGFLFMGGAVSGVVGVAFWTMGMSLRSEMDMGTLEPSWLTPTRRETLVIGRAVQGVLITGVVQAALFAIGIAFFGLRLRWDALRALPAMAVMLAALLGVGFLVAAMVLLAREANFLVDTTNFLFGMLSGIAFPITVLPLALQAVAVLLPTTWAIEILRADAIGARTILDVRLEHLILVASAAVLVPLGLWAFRSADAYVRVHGTIGQH
ncbi:MAG: ABC transporter permease, partial [Chloroflexi bacterium]|nr:ABC transporter permease [Chloroflexota bacterium]